MTIGEELDRLYELVDGMEVAGETDMIDHMLKVQNIADLSPEMMVGYLTITFDIKRLLPARAKFFADVKFKLIADLGADRAERILKGLE